MEQVPVFLAISFGCIVLLALGLFYIALRKSNIAIGIIAAWIVIQSLIGLTGFYTVTAALPPRLLLAILPPQLVILVLFTTRLGRAMMDQIDMGWLTLFHVIRLPIELVLFGLCVYGVVPQIMTFEGRNLDILSGISAPLVYYWGYKRGNMSRRVILGWNLACLVLLVNVVAHAILSTPTLIQQFGFDHPNVAILYFPFLLLPASIVPMVFFAHLVAIRRLWLGE
jgi:hypothetical protein